MNVGNSSSRPPYHVPRVTNRLPEHKRSTWSESSTDRPRRSATSPTCAGARWRRSCVGDGDREPDAGLVLRPWRHLHRRGRDGTRSIGAVDEGADLVDIGGVKAGPGDHRRRGRGDAAGGAVRRGDPGEVPGAVDQRGHLAQRRRPAAVAEGADLINDTWAGADPDLVAGRRRNGRGHRLLPHRRRRSAHPSAPCSLRRCGGRGDRRSRRRRRECRPAGVRADGS